MFSEADGGTASVTVLLLVVASTAVGLLTLALYLRRRRRRLGPRYHLPRAVHAAALTATEEEVRATAQREVVELGETLAADQDERAPERLRHALDAYAAAGTVLERARSLADLAGVLALVAEGRDALEAGPEAEPLPLCFFQPLHGRGQERVGWRPVGYRQTLTVSACAVCAGVVRARRAPEVLIDRYRGREMPYFQIPAECSVWSATGYGSFGGDSLTARVRRGDFSRGLRRSGP
ncbi:hypothetical protein [Streptomyces sp. TP-A0875]|uniref:hypothetical protein n=1 Tax=Streptomyces sp. TP-A0875 TaxID=552354 RepID=UPI000A3F901E|nr:hypothetical protein [Streptomyces sp. TP-A0875]